LQKPEPQDNTKKINAEDTKYIQRVTESFLYYGGVVGPLLLHALSKNTSTKTAPTENIKKQVDTFLNYMSWHPTVIVRLYTSDMILQVHSYTSYLTAPKAQSRTGVNFFIESIPVDGKYII
jgi:hypothetical protein